MEVRGLVGQGERCLAGQGEQCTGVWNWNGEPQVGKMQP